MITSFVAIDIETTGLSPEENQIIEVGALRVREGEVVESLSILINPGISLPQKIVELTGITDEMLMGQQSFREHSKTIYEFLGDEPLLGHNIRFDYSFLKYHLGNSGYTINNNVLDTLTIAKGLHPEFLSRSLASMCSAYGLVNKAAHRAFEDARVTMELYLEMCRRIQSTSEEERKALMPLTEPTNCYVKVKKQEPITAKQKIYLNDLLKYHIINKALEIDKMTKSQASKAIDHIILNYGKIR